MERDLEPPIELQDRRSVRVSVDSLQRDIADAIRAAGYSSSAAASNPDSRLHRRVPTLESVATDASSARASYVDFDAESRTSKGRLAAKLPRSTALAKAEQIRRRLMARSLSSTSRLLRPLKALRRPFFLAQEYWRRRTALPPTPDGRKVPVSLDIDTKGLIDERSGKRYVSNVVSSAIYTAYDFVPRQLIAQFSKLANLYFLFVSILQMIPSWSTTGNYTTIVPLCVFVAISMSREGYEDWRRHRNDLEENNRTVLVAHAGADGEVDYETRVWKNVRVGDVVRVLQNEWIPADLVLLHSSGMKGQCSIETLALDGETTLKSREVPARVQDAFRVESVATSRALCTVEDPNLNLFNFEGTMRFDGETQVTPIGNQNVVYRGSALRNTASIMGVVVFTGKETKMQLNASKNSRTKAPKLQGRVNKIVMLLAAFVLLLSGFSTLAAGRIQAHRHYWYLDGLKVTTTQNIMGFIIMFNTLIPLSLYVSMEICKVFQQFHMQNDIDMYDPVNDVRCSVQTASLNEELGQVSYIFSDKTGTLTDNVMLFRKMSIAGHPWIHDIDLYFEDDEESEDAYLFHKAHPMNIEGLDSEEQKLLEQLARLPRRSFGGRISNAARISMGRPSMGRLSIGRPSLGRPSLGRSSMGNPSMARASMGRPPAGRPSMSRMPANAPTSPNHGSTLKKEIKPSKSRVSTSVESVNSGQFYDAKEPTSPRMSTARPFASGASSPKGGSLPPPPSFARSSMGGRPSVSPSVQWQATASPYKPQSTPSTLTLLEYIMAHPHSAFAQRAQFFLLALALCHSASPEVDLNRESDGTLNIEQLDYQAASPDELALVAAARDLGYLVIDRQYDTITVRTYPEGFDNPPRDDVYHVLDTIEFTSARKRMSVVIQLPDGKIVLFCKGADNVMIERLHRSLLGAAQTKQESLYKEAFERKSVEAELANFERSPPMSIDAILQRSHVDAAIQESGRRSMQLRAAQDRAAQERASAHSPSPGGQASPGSPSSPVSPGRRSFSQASGSIKQAVDAATANATRASMSADAASPFAGSRQPKAKKHMGDLDLETGSERQALERTLEQIDEFSTEGLRTLLYGHRFLTASEYASWKQEYDEARSSISDRQAKVDAVGEKLERDFHITGATAIEDKLQRGVPEAIDKLRRANIKMWMLTGDKRETAVNIGYSCRLIKDFSTVITLHSEDDLEAKVMAALDELSRNNIAHCVVVIDGQTLAMVESDSILLSLFLDLGMLADSVILCRASPAQKGNIVKSIRRREPSKVTLAIGDGANDIAMIQAADVGVGIAGREGLQAARSSDFSIGQFRFLLKLLFVHGRWNYVRTCKYILATFYKEFMFYMGQVVFQRNTMFTGTSLYESWSISMFNTLFTSLPVICLGIMHQDLNPTTLIAVPELYHLGPDNKEFSVTLLIEWLVVAMLQCVNANFLAYKFYGGDMLVKDLSLYPLGVTVYTSVVGIVCCKIQFITMMHYITLISVLVVLVSCGGYLLFNILLGLVYIVNPSKTYFAEREFWNQLGVEVTYWATVFLSITIGLLFELVLKGLGELVRPTDTTAFQFMERDPHIMSRLENESEMELQQGWEYQDKLDHSWLAIFRGKWPAQARKNNKAGAATFAWKRRRMDVLAEKLRLKKPVDYDKEIQEILERRQRETSADAQP